MLQIVAHTRLINLFIFLGSIFCTCCEKQIRVALCVINDLNNTFSFKACMLQLLINPCRTSTSCFENTSDVIQGIKAGR